MITAEDFIQPITMRLCILISNVNCNAEFGITGAIIFNPLKFFFFHGIVLLNYHKNTILLKKGTRQRNIEEKT